jgi:Glycosyl transferase family 2
LTKNSDAGDGDSISVIIPVYNRQDRLSEALNAVAAQRPRGPEEVLVIDDASTDESGSVAAQMGATVLHQSTNGGPGAARDRGINAATSTWCAFLDSDDVWSPHHLARLREVARDDLGLIGSSALEMESNHIRVVGNPFRRPVTLHSAEEVLRPENVVMTSACMVRTSLAREVGGFGTGRLAEDLDLWMRILGRAKGLLLPDITVRYIRHPGQISSDPAMWSTAGNVVRHYPGLSSSTSRNLRTTNAWDGTRRALRMGTYKEALQWSMPLYRPTALVPLVELLYRRRERRKRWTARFDEVVELLSDEELADARLLSERRTSISRDG